MTSKYTETTTYKNTKATSKFIKVDDDFRANVSEMVTYFGTKQSSIPSSYAKYLTKPYSYPFELEEETVPMNEMSKTLSIETLNNYPDTSQDEEITLFKAGF